MPELRKDPIIGRWVIISTKRSQRPLTFRPDKEKAAPKLCPFCPGNEENTPPEITAYRSDGSEPDKSGWTLRVIPNKYPALIVEGDLNRQAIGPYDKMHGVGAHEVIIETDEHDKEIVDMTDEQVRDIFWCYRERMLDLAQDIRLKYILIFKNHGESAGASLEHPHSQLIATPIVPKRVAEEIDGAKLYYEFKNRCVFCDIVEQELEDSERVVFENESFVAIQPFAPRFPFESWIIPKRHYSSYPDMPDKEYWNLGRTVKEMLQLLRAGLNDPHFNYIIHTLPAEKNHRQYYHWHLEIIPRLTRVAGFEWGSGFYINPTAPEVAAEFLREIRLKQPVST
jgi:UDPglucose--hexose-1-phosphate uridylyltransferase